jgi:uncharacterized Zn-finger protein
MIKDLCECGKDKYEWQDICWVCKEKKEIQTIWEYSKDKKEVTNEKYVICPYCGSHYGEDDLHESTELTCDECGKKFKLEVEYDITYSTFQKGETKCQQKQ